MCGNKCPDGTWGLNCNKTCDCHNGAGCDHVNGSCICPPGYMGLKVGIFLIFSTWIILIWVSTCKVTENVHQNNEKYAVLIKLT